MESTSARNFILEKDKFETLIFDILFVHVRRHALPELSRIG